MRSSAAQHQVNLYNTYRLQLNFSFRSNCFKLGYNFLSSFGIFNIGEGRGGQKALF